VNGIDAAAIAQSVSFLLALISVNGRILSGQRSNPGIVLKPLFPQLG
jgi:hypothetical protein